MKRNFTLFQPDCLLKVNWLHVHLHDEGITKHETNGPHKRLYTVISVVEHGSLVQNLGCFKSMSSLTTNYCKFHISENISGFPLAKVCNHEV